MNYCCFFLNNLLNLYSSICREIVQYSAAADSTIPSNKRKIEDADIKEEYSDAAIKKDIKQEPEGKVFYNLIFFSFFLTICIKNIGQQPPKKKKKKNKDQANGEDKSINNGADISVKSEQESILTEGTYNNL